MLDTLLDPAFTGTDLALCLFTITAAALGARHDRKRNAR